MFPDFLSLVSTLRDCNKKQYIGIQKLETVQVPGSHVQHKYQVHERVCVNQNDVSTNPSRRIRKVYLLLICLCHPSSHILACACSYAYACIVYGNQPLGILNLFCGHYKKPNSQKTLSSWELVWLVIKELAWLVNMGACLIGYQGACLIGYHGSNFCLTAYHGRLWLVIKHWPTQVKMSIKFVLKWGCCKLTTPGTISCGSMAFTQEITCSYQNTCKVEYCMLIRNLTACMLSRLVHKYSFVVFRV